MRRKAPRRLHRRLSIHPVTLAKIAGLGRLIGCLDRISVLTFLVCLSSNAVMAQSAGAFTSTGAMSTARECHTATLLPNGKVLIAGGDPARSAELYDPASGTFAPTGSMISVPAVRTATLLPTRKVLITGGASCTDAFMKTAGAELYDPATGVFTPTGSMTTSRTAQTATLLNDGRVLIAGGGDFPGACCHDKSAELYDPYTESFAPTGDMITARPVRTATLLPNGKVLVVLSNDVGDGSDAAQLYDPDTGTFSPTEWNGRGADAAVVIPLTNGKALVTYQAPEGEVGYNRAEIYDPSSKTFAKTADTIDGRFDPSGTLLSDGTVLIVGSYLPPCGAFPGAELYDPAAGKFSATGNASMGRAFHTATLLNNGQVLIAGGLGPDECNGSRLSSAELYQPPSVPPPPALLSLSGDGLGQGVILHSGSSQVASSGNPANIGETVELYCSGLIDDGVLPPQVAIGGRMAQILLFGKAPGMEGFNQVNVRIPSGVAPGPAVPVRMTYLGRISNEVTLAVQ